MSDHNMEMEMRIFSAFCRDNPRLLDKLPTRVKTYAEEQSSEQLLCVSQYSMETMRQRKGPIDDPQLRVQCYSEPRGHIEHFGANRYQVVVAACIHSDKDLLLLKLKEAPAYIDGYHEGTLTYPQGHARFDPKMAGSKYFDDIYGYPTLRTYLDNEIMRELSEELIVEGGSLHYKFFEQLALNVHSAKIYPIYVNHPGSTGRHLCLVYDVDVRRFMQPEWLQEVRSNEPEKHSVQVVQYKDLLTLPRLDYLCTWVLASFSKIPFYGNEFLADYLKVKVN